MSARLHSLQDLIIVAGHAPFKAAITEVPAQPERDEHWVLQSFQSGEPPLYLGHIRCGVELLARNSDALLLFSGGLTRREAGRQWSEGATYRALARHFNWWLPASKAGAAAHLDQQTDLETFSRDSFENLLFSLCRFQQLTHRFPRHTTLISWAFKETRFDWHRAVLRYPRERFAFVGPNNPPELADALRGEEETLRAFTVNFYGNDGRLLAKRAERNPYHQEHPFRSCPGMAEFFAYIENPANAGREYPCALPWDDHQGETRINAH